MAKISKVEGLVGGLGVERFVKSGFGANTEKQAGNAVHLFSAFDTNWHNRQFANETVKKPQITLGLLSIYSSSFLSPNH